MELKKKNWKFNKKFETWFKKAETGAGLPDGVSPFFANIPQTAPS